MLAGKTVFVSGGSGYIGTAICRALVEHGAQVIFSYHRNEKRAVELARQLTGVRAMQIDLQCVDEIMTKIQALYQEVHQIDVLVNNAGVSQVMPFAMIEEEDFDHLMTVNIKGPFFLTKAIIRGMIRNKQGNIINIGSIAGHRMYDVPVHYAVSKAAVPGFTYALAAEVKRFGIRVNTIVPGLIEDGVSRGISDELKEDFSQHCAVGRPGTGAEVAEVVCFLASDRASYVNAQNIFVDGGI